MPGTTGTIAPDLGSAHAVAVPQRHVQHEAPQAPIAREPRVPFAMAVPRRPVHNEASQDDIRNSAPATAILVEDDEVSSPPGTAGDRPPTTKKRNREAAEAAVAAKSSPSYVKERRNEQQHAEEHLNEPLFAQPPKRLRPDRRQEGPPANGQSSFPSSQRPPPLPNDSPRIQTSTLLAGLPAPRNASPPAQFLPGTRQSIEFDGHMQLKGASKTALAAPPVLKSSAVDRTARSATRTSARTSLGGGHQHDPINLDDDADEVQQVSAPSASPGYTTRSKHFPPKG